MSAVAFTCTREQIILLSDGRVEEDGQQCGTDHRKVFKVDPHTGVLWMGAAAMWSSPIIDALQTSDVKGVAQQIGQVLKRAFEMKDLMSILKTHRYAVFVIGYDGGKPKLYNLDSKYEDIRFTPKQVPIRFGQMGCLSYAADALKTPYQRLVSNKYMPKLNDTLKASKAAFKEMVEEYEAEGQPVGGQLFCETLKPGK